MGGEKFVKTLQMILAQRPAPTTATSAGTRRLSPRLVRKSRSRTKSVLVHTSLFLSTFDATDYHCESRMKPFDPTSIRRPRTDERPLWDLLEGILGAHAVLVAHELKLFPLL